MIHRKDTKAQLGKNGGVLNMYDGDSVQKELTAKTLCCFGQTSSIIDVGQSSKYAFVIPVKS